LLSSLKISDQLTQAAFEVAGGAPDIAVNMILEHRRVLEASFTSEVSAPSTGTDFPPVIAGIVEALVEANSELAGAELLLAQQLRHLQHRLGTLSRFEVFCVVLGDVFRRLQDMV